MKKMLLLLVCLTTFVWLHAETATFTCKDNYGSSTVTASTWKLNDYLTFTYAKGSNSNPPAYNKAGDVRVYAGNTVTLTATNDYKIEAIAFTLSSQGKSRYPSVIANTGLVGAQAVGDSQCTWSGDATTVTFTVGDKSIYATDKTKAGQLCYTSVTVTYSKVADKNQVAKPTFSYEGEVEAGTKVEIDCKTADAKIYYTTDETDPTVSSTLYDASTGIIVNEAMTIKAIAVKEDLEDSEIATATYTIKKPVVATPIFDPVPGAVKKGTEVTITCGTEGATLMYQVNGDIQEGASPVTVVINEATTIEVIASKDGYVDSEATAKYTIIGEIETAPQAFFDFTKPENLGLTAENGTKIPDVPITLNGITVVFSKGTSNDPVVWDNGGFHIRVYKGATITVSAGEGQSIESIQFKGATLFRIQYNGTAIAKSGETTVNWWNPTLNQRAANNEVQFTVDNSGRVDINSINVNDPVVTGVEDVTVDENAPVEYYNLQGVRVANPENGIYIRRQGSKVSKVLVK